MKNTNTAKKQTSQSASANKNTATHIKLVKPRPSGTEAGTQGPRDCFPLG